MDLARMLKKTVEPEDNRDTNCSLYIWNDLKRFGK